jgi:hypothetical protein
MANETHLKVFTGLLVAFSTMLLIAFRYEQRYTDRILQRYTNEPPNLRRHKLAALGAFLSGTIVVVLPFLIVTT